MSFQNLFYTFFLLIFKLRCYYDVVANSTLIVHLCTTINNYNDNSTMKKFLVLGVLRSQDIKEGLNFKQSIFCLFYKNMTE